MLATVKLAASMLIITSDPPTMGVTVDVGAGVVVAVAVGEAVTVGVTVSVGVIVGVNVAVAVGLIVAVGLTVPVGDNVGVGVTVGVIDGVAPLGKIIADICCINGIPIPVVPGVGVDPGDGPNPAGTQDTIIVARTTNATIEIARNILL